MFNGWGPLVGHLFGRESHEVCVELKIMMCIKIGGYSNLTTSSTKTYRHICSKDEGSYCLFLPLSIVVIVKMNDSWKWTFWVNYETNPTSVNMRYCGDSPFHSNNLNEVL